MRKRTTKTNNDDDNDAFGDVDEIRHDHNNDHDDADDSDDFEYTFLTTNQQISSDFAKQIIQNWKTHQKESQRCKNLAMAPMMVVMLITIARSIEEFIK